MAQNCYKGDSDTILITLAANVSSGDPVVSAGRIAVAKVDGLNTAIIPAFVRGQFTFAKLTGGGTAWTVGVPVHWDTNALSATKTPSAVTVYLGVAVAAVADGGTTGVVDINVRQPLPLVPAAGGASHSQAEWAAFIVQLTTYGYARTA
jgi:predicted RecA/RadA family phage recombinase